MRTDQRLTNTYHNAKIEYFDEDSKYIFFSDCHRGDDSISDEFARNQSLMLHALRDYYSKGYTYIEVGDGDELWEYKYFKHIRTAHTDVFTAIKAFWEDHRFIMLYGNHNIFLKDKAYVAKHYYTFFDEYADKKAPLLKGIIPLEGLVLKHKKTNQEILVVHGHQGDLMNDQLWRINMFFLRYFWRFIHVVGFKNPSSPAKNQSKRHKIEKNYTKWIRKHRIPLLCGHTHRLKFPREGELPYFNTGCCIHTKGISGIEIIDDQIMLVQWRTEADDNGNLNIAKHIIRGPAPLTKFRM
ncbi:MAG: metallophosphoesterase [Cellulosilyticaceae bacterium]